MKNLTKSKAVKLASGFVGVAMALALVATPVFADTAANLQATINSLMAQIQAAQAQLTALNGGTTTTTTTGSTGYTFNTNLTMGSTGADVMNLQKVLNMSADTQVASTGAGSPGNESSYFGGLTEAAVIKFQTKYGISPAAGYVGPITRAKLNSMTGTTVSTGTTTTGTLPAGCTSSVGYSSTTGQACSTGTTGTVLPTGGNLTVMAGVQPTNSLAPESAARVPFTTITLTAGASDVTVNSITVQRSGLAQDGAFAGIDLIDSNGLQIGIAKTLNSNHQAVVGNPFVIPAGTSKTITIAGNMASVLDQYAGEVASLDVVAINTSATVAGSLPITGAQQTINASLQIGNATLNSSSFDPNSAATQPIGTTGYRFSGVRITAGSAEDVTLKSISWNQTGSVGATDLANLVTIVNGTSYPTVVDSSGKYFTTVFPSGIVITKGNSVDAYIQGDIVGSGAAGRTAEFDIYKTTDIYMVGNTYGYGVNFTAGNFGTNTDGTYVGIGGTHGSAANIANNPFFLGSTLSITSGSVTLIGKANEVAAQNIAPAVSNQVLGGFATNFAGEPVSVQTMPFTLTTSPDLGGAITSVTLVDSNGNVVAGPQDVTTYTGGQTVQNVTFSDTVTFPIGRAVYTLKGKLPTNAPNGATIIAATTPSAWGTVTGQTTGNNISLQTLYTPIQMNTVTVKGAALAVNVSAQPASQNIVAGSQNLVLANYVLDATQSGEDLRLSSMPIEIEAVAAALPSDLTGCALFNGTTQLNTGSRVVNYTSTTQGAPVEQTYSFDQSLTVPKGTSLTLSLQCNVLSSRTSGSYEAIHDTANPDWSVTGVTSGNAVTTTAGTLTFGYGDGGIMAVNTGSFSIAADSSTPNYTTVAGGTTGAVLGVFKFHANNEAINLTKVGLVLTSGSAADLANAYVYNGSTLLGTVSFPQAAGSGAVATSTFSSPLLLPANTDVLLTVKADMAPIGSGLSGTAGKLVKIDVTNAEGSGLSSGQTLKTGGVTPGSLGVRTFKSFPTIAQDTMSSSGVLDGHLMRFKVTANSSGPVGIYGMAFTIATSGPSGSSVTLAKVNVYTDSGYSQVAGGNFGASNGQFGATTASGLPGNSTKIVAFNTSTENPLEIPAGSTYYFSLDAQIAAGGASAGGFSVTSTLLGDTTFFATTSPAGLSTATDIASTTITGATASQSINDFVWSGNTLTSSAAGAYDWANGYGLLNLPSGGFTQTRSN